MIATAMIVAFASCSNKEKQESSKVISEKPVELKPVDQTAVLSGHVGPGGVHMTLNIKGDLVEGEYSYNKYNSPLRLQGKLEEDGHLELHEVNDEGKPTGHFDGYFDKDNGYSGEFVNFQGSHFTFDLTIDNITDNAGDGEGRGFLSTWSSDRPETDDYSSNDESGSEFDDDAQSSYNDARRQAQSDWDNAQRQAQSDFDEAKRQARRDMDEAYEQAKRDQDEALDEAYGKTGAKVLKKLSGYDEAREEMDKNYEESKEALGY